MKYDVHQEHGLYVAYEKPVGFIIGEPYYDDEEEEGQDG